MDHLCLEPGSMFTPAPRFDGDDSELVERICRAYRFSMDTFGDSDTTRESQWTLINRRKLDVHQAILSGIGAAEVLRDPSSNHLLEGFENIFQPAVQSLREGNGDVRAIQVYIIRDALFRFMQAIGLRRLANPEAPYRTVPETGDIEEAITEIEKVLGFEISFPNLFKDEFGVQTSRGVISVRAVYALYQVHMINSLLPDPSSRSVMEIGGGLGRTALYAFHSGIRDYTIVDLPLTSAAQAYFLGRLLGPDKITLAGEALTGCVKLLSPAALSERRAKLVMCIDALTEMQQAVAVDYVQFAFKHADVLFTISHEVNEFTAQEVIAQQKGGSMKLHALHALRPGYVEDIVLMRRSAT